MHNQPTAEACITDHSSVDCSSLLEMRKATNFGLKVCIVNQGAEHRGIGCDICAVSFVGGQTKQILFQ